MGGVMSRGKRKEEGHKFKSGKMLGLYLSLNFDNGAEL
jgi:hypothetical protein